MCDRCSYCNDGTLLPCLWLTFWWKKRKATVASWACCFDPSCWNSCLKACHWFRDGECKSDIQTGNTVPDSSTQSQIPQYVFLMTFFLSPSVVSTDHFIFCLFVCLMRSNDWTMFEMRWLLNYPHLQLSSWEACEILQKTSCVARRRWLEWTANHSCDGWPVWL